ncbi:hypothetical protein [Pseudoflavonifractor phocaeensis]|uniref:hypothetical protein n=1 Tax=Pseudoflavonifractor phocaeensis TaxID=1870988 RepID=UPI00195AF4C3|nr:hypothetical protein [Pseudoflavonifractor phocaeensis]MBM6927501.1 hypothetical protein [Pseudoflavonifractor phocaeensis]
MALTFGGIGEDDLPGQTPGTQLGLNRDYISSLATGFRDWLDKHAQMSDNLLTK